MRLRNYLSEANIFSYGPARIYIKSENKDYKIPENPDVILLGDAPKPKKTVMIYRNRNGNINTEDSYGNKNKFKSIEYLINYLNKKGFVYFEGYNRI